MIPEGLLQPRVGHVILQPGLRPRQDVTALQDRRQGAQCEEFFFNCGRYGELLILFRRSAIAGGTSERGPGLG